LCPTPCQSCPKVPEWVKASGADWRECRAAADELSEADRKALAVYVRCKATLRFPDDPIVAWYSGVFRGCEDELDAERAREPGELVSRLVELMLVSFRMRR
jgi:hypothetical protein